MSKAYYVPGTVQTASTCTYLCNPQPVLGVSIIVIPFSPMWVREGNFAEFTLETLIFKHLPMLPPNQRALAVYQANGTQPGAILPSRRHLAMSRDLLVV